MSKHPAIASRSRTIINPRLREAEISVKRYYPSMPGFYSLPWRERLAWRLRFWATKLDGGLSYSVSGKFPASMKDQDLYDAFCFGITAMQQYMIDLFDDRRNKERIMNTPRTPLNAKRNLPPE